MKVRFQETIRVWDVPSINNGRRVGKRRPQRWLSDEGVRMRKAKFRYSEKRIAYLKNQLKLRLIYQVKRLQKDRRFMAFVILATWLIYLL